MRELVVCDERAGMHNQNQEPHTKMWGINRWQVFVLGIVFKKRTYFQTLEYLECDHQYFPPHV